MSLRIPALLSGVFVFALAAGGGGEEVHGIDASDLDRSADPCRQFFEYANGGWLKKNPIPSDYPSWGAFYELDERNRETIHGILEKLSAGRAAATPGSEEKKLGDFYSVCLDEKAIEAQGIEPLRSDFERIAKIAIGSDLQEEIARLQRRGVDAVFLFGSEQDRKSVQDVIGAAQQGGLGLPDRDYYLKTDADSKKTRAAYRQHVEKMLELSGEPKEKAAAHAKAILALETKLAEGSTDNVARRNPDKTYHKMSVDELQKRTPRFSWAAYFRTIGAPPVPAVNVWDPRFFDTMNRLLGEVPLETWRAYLRWRLVSEAAPSLSSKFVDANFEFYGRQLQGTPQILPRWKRCTFATDGALGMALGKKFVEQRFPPESKARAQEMIRNMIVVLGEDIRSLPWMGEATKKAALEKLAAFDAKIGYPDKWRDYSAYAVASAGPHVVNVMNGNEFEHRRDLAKIGKPVDRTDWEMSPPEVNAYYNSQKNEIVFPAGILQPPFFDGKADDAVNYGGIGAVIGHEMTHGFDDEGRKFDAQGNQRDWWTPEDAKSYEARAACVEKQFSGYVVEGDLHVNGKLVLGESIADLGGLKIAYNAFRRSLEGKSDPGKIDGFTPDERFFLAFARNWAGSDRPEFARLITNTNPHPLDRFRAIGAPSNMPEFARAFSCRAGDPMVRAEVCAIW